MGWPTAALLGLILWGGGEQGDPRVEYVRTTWTGYGRSYVASMSGTRWDATARRWRTDTAWGRAGDVADALYEAEPPIRAALSVAIEARDTAWLGELADLYLAIAPRFEPLGRLRTEDGTLLAGAGPDERRILRWRDWSRPGKPLRECLLCAGQILHPAARLVRAAAELPAGLRPARLIAFVRLYTPLIVQEHLLDGGYRSTTQLASVRGLPRTLVPFWEATTAVVYPPERSAVTAFRDRDLWLVGAAAELLRARVADQGLVRISVTAADSLRRLVRSGSARWAVSAVSHPETRDWEGRQVGSIGLFEGDFRAHPDYAYTGDTGAAYPVDRPEARSATASWDVSHATRIPVVLRSLWDARGATGVPWPDSAAVRGIVRGYLYRAFNGDLAAPRLRNFLDGTDGWYRVGYAARAAFGYPPSAECDGANPRRPCLGSWGVMGWGMLGGADPDLVRLGDALDRLAGSIDPVLVRHRGRYFRAYGRDLGVMGPDGRPQMSLLLAIMYGDQIAGRTFTYDDRAP